MNAPNPNAPTPFTPKLGRTTSEFWVTVGTSLVTLAVAVGTLVSPNFNLDGVQAVIPAAATIAAAIATATYSNSRSNVKVAAHAATGDVFAAQRTSTAAAAGGGQPNAPAQIQPATDITTKPGPTTSEFWTTVGTSLVTLIVAVGTLVNPNFNLDGVQALIPAFATIAAAIATAVYSNSRSKVKVAAQTANANVITARLTSTAAAAAGASQRNQAQQNNAADPSAVAAAPSGQPSAFAGDPWHQATVRRSV